MCICIYICVCVCVCIPSLLSLPPHLSPHHTPLGHHRVPGLAPCAIKQLPTSYLTDDSAYVCVCINIYIYIYQCYFFNSSHPSTAAVFLSFCGLMNYIVHGTLQARILEWEAFPFSKGSSQPRDQTQVSLIAGGLNQKC